MSVHEAVQNAVLDASRHVQESLAAEATNNPRWQNIAEHIEVWSQDGRYWVGVQNADSVSEAMAAEYGDSENPPASLIRANTARLDREVSEIIDRHLATLGSSYAA